MASQQLVYNEANNNSHVVAQPGGGQALKEQYDSALFTNTSLTGNSTGYVYWGANGSNTGKPVNGKAATATGNKVCTDGANSGTHCNLTVQNAATAWVLPSTQRTIHGFVSNEPTVGVAAALGDSGGPVVVERSDGGVTARGIISATSTPVGCPAGLLRYTNAGESNCFHDVYAVPIQTVLDAWGAEVILAGQ